jgi:1-acyl-sn-glycerol-3-phosphate acyltransferase
LHFYCRKIVINYKDLLSEKGPLLIAANHPNSFLDAIIISTVFKQPVYSLARGDVFANRFFSKVLQSVNMLPVYRLSEGAENLGYNYLTFEVCKKLFEEQNVVLIFSEGGCTNEWKLRPLKKGTARLAISAWKENIPLKVLPLGINYNSFRSFGKNVHLNFGKIITPNDLEFINQEGKAINIFNEKLEAQLKNLVYHIEPNDRQKLHEHFYEKPSTFKKIILFIPAVIGFILNAPLYFIIHLFIKDRAEDHYDSIMTGILFFFYPVYVLALTLVLFFVTRNVLSFFLLLVMPFTAWSYLQVKPQIKK